LTARALGPAQASRAFPVADRVVVHSRPASRFTPRDPSAGRFAASLALRHDAVPRRTVTPESHGVGCHEVAIRASEPLWSFARGCSFLSSGAFGRAFGALFRC
jgi:hypothetical protein